MKCTNCEKEFEVTDDCLVAKISLETPAGEVLKAVDTTVCSECKEELLQDFEREIATLLGDNEEEDNKEE